MGQNKTDLVTCIKNVEEVVQQTLSNGSEDLQNSATELVQRIESAVTEVCDSNSAKVGQLVEQHLKTYGSSVKEAISDLAQKEAEVQRHLNNVFSELYAPNGYTFSGLSGGERLDFNYYFPQAEANFMALIRLNF